MGANLVGSRYKSSSDWRPEEIEAVQKLMVEHNFPCHNMARCCSGNFSLNGCYGWGCAYNEFFVWFVEFHKEELPSSIWKR